MENFTGWEVYKETWLPPELRRPELSEGAIDQMQYNPDDFEPASPPDVDEEGEAELRALEDERRLSALQAGYRE